MFARIRSLTRALTGRSRFERDMQDEIRFHVDARAADLRAAGVPAQAAARQARLEFGPQGRVEEECREAFGLRAWDTLARNLRFAARLLRRDPAFTAAAVLTLALCIGANTAVFTVVDTVLLRPLPYPSPDRLAEIVTAFSVKGAAGEQAGQTGEVWEAVRDRVPSVDAAVVGAMVVKVNLAAGAHVESLRQHRVSAGFFKALGVRPALGREFSIDEDRPGGAAAVVLSHDAWRRVFDANPAAVGRSVFLRGEPYTIVGVMPEGFQSIQPADLWTPVQASRGGEGGGSNYLVFGRLKAGRSWPQAESEAMRASGDIFRAMDLPPGSTARLHLIPLQRGLTDDVRRPLLLLWAAVIAVLVVGCANVAGLLLARSSARAREIATRVALGGGRAAVVWQLLTESLVLAAAGGVAGALVGWLALGGLQRGLADAFGLVQPLRLDARVLAVTMAGALGTSLLFGLFPAIRALRLDVRRALVDGGARGVAGGSRQWPRRLLVVTQVSLGLALVVSAGLLVRTAARLYAQPPGFDTHNVLAGEVSLLDARYRDTASVTRLFDSMLSRLRALPGVEAAGVALTLPYERALNLGFRPLDGRTGDGRVTSAVYVTAGFFKALRVTIVRGRDVEDGDKAGTRGVALVNEAFARYYYRGRDVLGEKIDMGGHPLEIVGVAADVQQKPGWGEFGPVSAVPTVYVPVAQMADRAIPLIHTWFSPSIVVRSNNEPALLIGAMQREMSAVDPLLPFSGFRNMEEVRSSSLAGERVRAQLLGGLALLAVLLTFVGLYGLVASGVSERLHEVGIRLALGASRAATLRELAGQGVMAAAAGVACGGGLAAVAVQGLRGLVWGVPLFDPWTFAIAAAGVLLLSVAASIVPALAATRTDPARILRSE
jgi:predicted permease